MKSNQKQICTAPYVAGESEALNMSSSCVVTFVQSSCVKFDVKTSEECSWLWRDCCRFIISLSACGKACSLLFHPVEKPGRKPCHTGFRPTSSCGSQTWSHSRHVEIEASSWSATRSRLVLAGFLPDYRNDQTQPDQRTRSSWIFVSYLSSCLLRDVTIPHTWLEQTTTWTGLASGLRQACNHAGLRPGFRPDSIVNCGL